MSDDTVRDELTPQVIDGHRVLGVVPGIPAAGEAKTPAEDDLVMTSPHLLVRHGFIGPDDPPAIEKNADTMEQFRDQLREYYYDPSRYDTYLDQLGVDYPQFVRP